MHKFENGRNLSPLAEEVLQLLNYQPFNELVSSLGLVPQFSSIQNGLFDETQLPRFIASFLKLCVRFHNQIPSYLNTLAQKASHILNDQNGYSKMVLPIQERRLDGADSVLRKLQKEFGNAERGLERAARKTVRVTPIANISQNAVLVRVNNPGNLLDRSEDLNRKQEALDQQNLRARILAATRARMNELGIPLHEEVRLADQRKQFQQPVQAAPYVEYPEPRRQKGAPVAATPKPQPASETADAGNLERSVILMKELIELAGKNGTITIIVPDVGQHAIRHLKKWREALQSLGFSGKVIGVEPKNVGRSTNNRTVILVPYAMLGVSSKHLSNLDNVRTIPLSQPKLISNYVEGNSPTTETEPDTVSQLSEAAPNG